MEHVRRDFCQTGLKDMSVSETEEFANKAAKKEALIERNRPHISPSVSLEVKILLMSRLGIPVDRIAARLKVNRKTVLKYSQRNSLTTKLSRR